MHRDVYDDFLDGFVALTKRYVLGDPLNPETTLGPLVRTRAAEFVRGQIAEAIAHGARGADRRATFAATQPGTPYLAPQVLVNVDHSMRVMREETLRPGRVHHEGRRRRASVALDERQRVQLDRLDLDAL